MCVFSFSLFSEKFTISEVLKNESRHLIHKSRK